MTDASLTSDTRLSGVVSQMANRWSDEACTFLEGQDHSAYATGLVIASLIQMARGLMEDNNEAQRAMWVRVLAADGVGIVQGLEKTQ